MKLKRVRIKNFRKIEFFDWKSDGSGGVTVLEGECAQGKTSVIQGVIGGLMGKAACGANPIREGENSAEVLIETDEIRGP